jgi:SAM-dependent methyltransferase
MASPTLARHISERAYFDARPHNINFVPRFDLHRYSKPGTLQPIDRMFALAGDVAGKRVLDVGCGNGENAVMLAKLGADVVGIDISPESIRAAEDRCIRNRALARFICCPLEDAHIDGEFDIIWCDAFLHHMLFDFEGTIAILRAALAPDGVLLIKEPINLCGWLRRIRHAIGNPDGTPDERPLEPGELSLLCGAFARFEIHHYRVIGRLEQWVSPRLLAWIDRALLLVPGMGRFASVAVIRCR